MMFASSSYSLRVNAQCVEMHSSQDRYLPHSVKAAIVHYMISNKSTSDEAETSGEDSRITNTGL